MGTFYLGLSMAGTVSAGTYTGGSLTEIINWLDSWQKAKSEGVILIAEKDTISFRKGDKISFLKDEIPNHKVKIKALSGASGGGVSAALLLTGISTGNVEELLREVWTTIDVRDMLNNDDLDADKNIYSLLNVKPIDEAMQKLLNQKWSDNDYAKSLDYLDDNIETFLTLASYEGIPYKVTPFKGNGVTYGIHKTHLDYIKFNFSKNGLEAPIKNNLPYAYNLVFNKNHYFKDDVNWNQLFQSAPATAAFPVGFKPRSLKRYLKEYNGKLFYMDYTNPSDSFKYSSLEPAWPDANLIQEPFNMEYLDGGTFNREPHDLVRASLIESLGLPNYCIPYDGISTNASVILIDPFPAQSTVENGPGQTVNGTPSLLKQGGFILGAMIDQGRFRPDWIEKALNDKYYSRYLISPIRRDNSGTIQNLSLAAGLLGAFSGFIDKSFREHDYKLGLYNTFQFLKANFTIPINNSEIDYYRNASDKLKEKYEAVGWYDSTSKECQIIPRMLEPNQNNSLSQPIWPTISEDKWNEVYNLALERGKALEDAATNFKSLNDVKDFAIWNMFLKNKVENSLNEIKQILIDNKLLIK